MRNNSVGPIQKFDFSETKKGRYTKHLRNRE